jgi:opacity protein-like surface antigen
MKRNILITITAITVLATSGAAYAGDWNVDVFAGKTAFGSHDFKVFGVLNKRDSNNGEIFGLGLSKSNVFIKNLEIGAEFSHQTETFKIAPGISGTETSLLATAKYNFVNTGAFQAYAGLGFGVTHLHSNTVGGGTAAAGMADLGIRYAVSANVKLFTEARYFTTFGDVNVAPGISDNFDNASLVVGLRTSF